MKKTGFKKISQIVAVVAVSSTAIYQYSRSDYKHWIDADKDCQNTRQEVLIAETIEKVVLDEKGCNVISGKWYDPYTDKYFTNPSDLDIDHFIPLKEVDRSGGHEWPKNKKMEYANDLDDPDILIAVDKSANRSKADKDPSNWMPPNKGYACEYIKTWQKLKKKWRLEMDEKERKFINLKNKECGKIKSEQ
jgi:hypothetical protein